MAKEKECSPKKEGDALWKVVESWRGKFLESDEEKDTYFQFMVTEMRRPRGKCTRQILCMTCYQFSTKSNMGKNKTHHCSEYYSLADVIGRANKDPAKAREYFEKVFIRFNFRELHRLGLVRRELDSRGHARVIYMPLLISSSCVKPDSPSRKSSSVLSHSHQAKGNDSLYGLIDTHDSSNRLDAAHLNKAETAISSEAAVTDLIVKQAIEPDFLSKRDAEYFLEEIRGEMKSTKTLVVETFNRLEEEGRQRELVLEQMFKKVNQQSQGPALDQLKRGAGSTYIWQGLEKYRAPSIPWTADEAALRIRRMINHWRLNEY